MHAPLDWSIRLAGAADADALALIAGATFLETYAGAIDGGDVLAFCATHHTAAAYRALLGGGSQAWLVEAAPGAAPIGYALAGPSGLENAEQGDWELKRIYVLSRFHGSGIAAALMTEVATAAAGYRRLVLGVKADNHRAQAYYRKQGFACVATRQFRVGDNTYDDLIMARPLDTEPLEF